MLNTWKIQPKPLSRKYNPQNTSSKTNQIIIAVIALIPFVIFYYFFYFEPRIKDLKIETEVKNSEHLQLDNISIKALPETHRRTIKGWSLFIKGTLRNVSNQEILKSGYVNLEFFDKAGNKIAKDDKVFIIMLCPGENIKIKPGESNSFDYFVFDQFFKGRDAQGLNKCILSIDEGP